MLEALSVGHRPRGPGRAGPGGLGNKLPALPEALQAGRPSPRLLVAELVAHLDDLEEAIGRLSG
jgi:hypothetical protein